MDIFVGFIPSVGEKPDATHEGIKATFVKEGNTWLRTLKTDKPVALSAHFTPPPPSSVSATFYGYWKLELHGSKLSTFLYQPDREVSKTRGSSSKLRYVHFRMFQL